MMPRRGGSGLLVGGFLLSVFGPGPGLAQSTVGSATTVEREALGVLSSQRRNLRGGEPVFQQELISTGQESGALLTFLDNSRITLGARATVRLDEFVFNPDRSARSMVLNSTRGVLRFIGGTTQHETYRIRTPHAILGIRGTIVDVLVGTRTVARLIEGSADFTNLQGRRRTIRLLPGQVAIAGPEGLSEPDSAAVRNLDLNALYNELGGARLVQAPVPGPTELASIIRPAGIFGIGVGAVGGILLLDSINDNRHAVGVSP